MEIRIFSLSVPSFFDGMYRRAICLDLCILGPLDMIRKRRADLLGKRNSGGDNKNKKPRKFIELNCRGFLIYAGM